MDSNHPVEHFAGPVAGTIRAPAHDHSEPYGRHNQSNEHQYRGDQSGCVPTPNARLKPYMNRVKYDRDHNREKDRSEKWSGNEITEIERNCGQSEQE